MKAIKTFFNFLFTPLGLNSKNRRERQEWKEYYLLGMNLWACWSQVVTIYVIILFISFVFFSKYFGFLFAISSLLLGLTRLALQFYILKIDSLRIIKEIKKERYKIPDGPYYKNHDFTDGRIREINRNALIAPLTIMVLVAIPMILIAFYYIIKDI